jgi:hypothetical protein
MKAVWQSDLVPDAEIEAAADAVRILWESNPNPETGFGPSYLVLAKEALEAALKVRGKNVCSTEGGRQ